MIAENLIAAMARTSRLQAEKAAKHNDPEEFKRRFAELYGRGATKGTVPRESAQADPATPTHDPTIFEDDETPPERLPDLPTVPDDPPAEGRQPENAQKRPFTGAEPENGTTTPQAPADAPTGRISGNYGASKGKRTGKAVRNGKKRTGKGKK